MANAVASNTQKVPDGKFMRLALGEIICDRNIRTEDPAILDDDGMDLVASIEANGVLEPVLVFFPATSQAVALFRQSL